MTRRRRHVPPREVETASFLVHFPRVRTEPDGGLHLGGGGIEQPPVLQPLDHRQMRLGNGRIDRNGRMGSSKAVIDVVSEAISQAGLGNSEQRPGLRIIWVDFDRAAANAHHPLLAAHVAMVAGDPILARHQVEVVGFDIGGPALLDRLLLFRQQLQLERGDDRFRNLVLDRENVLEVAVVALGPDMVAARAVDQLRVDAHPPAGLADAAFEHVADAELAGDVADIDRLALEREGGVARDHRQGRDFRQIGRDVLADPVAEIFLLGIAAHVGERQDAHAHLPPMCARRRFRRIHHDRGERLQARHQLAPARCAGVAAPSVEVGALDLVERHRRDGAIDRDLDQSAS